MPKVVVYKGNNEATNKKFGQEPVPYREPTPVVRRIVTFYAVANATTGLQTIYSTPAGKQAKLLWYLIHQVDSGILLTTKIDGVIVNSTTVASQTPIFNQTYDIAPQILKSMTVQALSANNYKCVALIVEEDLPRIA